MSAGQKERYYTIREAAAFSGLPASTLRFYEASRVIPAARRTDSGYRTYTQADIEMLTWVGCLAATGMPVARMREYVNNGTIGPVSAAEQRRLLVQQDERLAREQRVLELRRRYVQLKIEYWQAVEGDRKDDVERLAVEAAEVGESLKDLESENHAEDTR